MAGPQGIREVVRVPLFPVDLRRGRKVEEVVKPGLSLETAVEVVRGPRREGGHSRWREQPMQRPGGGSTAASETKEHRGLEGSGAEPESYGFQFQFIFSYTTFSLPTTLHAVS